MGWVVNATLRPLYPLERPGTHCIGSWMDPRAGLDGRGKSLPHRDSIHRPSGPQGRSGRALKISPVPGFDPQTLKPVASLYMDTFLKYSSEISPTRCNNCVFILCTGFTLHVSGDNLTHHQEYICCIWSQVSRLT